MRIICNDRAKGNGAKWDAVDRVWYIDNPVAYQNCKKRGLLGEHLRPRYPAKEWKLFSYEQRDRARTLGYVWDPEWKCHFKPTPDPTECVIDMDAVQAQIAEEQHMEARK